jgi:hypothetical protein
MDNGNTWEARMTARPARVPRLDLIELSWRATGPSGNVITCGLYTVDTGIEIRCGYSAENLVRSQLTREIGSAREIAVAWKQAAIAKGFEEVSEQ